MRALLHRPMANAHETRRPDEVPAADTRRATSALSLLGRYLPFARWSVLRMGLGARALFKNWQVGDGREEALAQFVVANARPWDVDDAIRVIDEFAYTKSFLINVGEEKGALLDAAVSQARPRVILELGTYCGYSALRILRAAPSDARLLTIEFNPANADVARRVFAHAGVAGRVAVIEGTLGDGGATIRALQGQHGVTRGSLDFVFIDHDKRAYVPDLERILREGWLRAGATIMADNIRIPGAPAYRAFMKANEGRLFRSREHVAHVEYQSLVNDVVLESEFLGAS